MVTVVIPAYNEAGTVGACLSSLAHQTYGKPFEIILVDNASTDRTAMIAARYRADLPLTVIRQPVKGRGIARKTGFDAARGDIILSTDADCILPTQWIAGMADALSDPAVDAVSGNITVGTWSGTRSRIGSLAFDAFMYTYRLTFGHFPIGGFNFGVRRRAYIASGGFDPALNAAEDVDLGRKLRLVGKIVYRKIPVGFDPRRYERSALKGILVYVRNEILCRTRYRNRIYLDDVR
jgi:glycosyltransferase involved in cell wall biosynthesis